MDFVTYLQQHIGHTMSIEHRTIGGSETQTREIRAVNRGWLMFIEEEGKTLPDIYIPVIHNVVCITCMKADMTQKGTTDADQN